MKWVTASERQFGIVWLLDSFRSFPQGKRVLALPFPDGGDDFVIAVRVSGTYDGSRPHDFDRQDLIQYWERAIEDILSKPAGNGLVWKWEEDKDGTFRFESAEIQEEEEEEEELAAEPTPPAGVLVLPSSPAVARCFGRQSVNGPLSLTQAHRALPILQAV